METILAALGIALTGTGLGIGIGAKLASRNGHISKDDLVPKENIVTKEECSKRHKSIEDKVTYTQYLLMETTTPDQQRTAREKVAAFRG